MFHFTRRLLLLFIAALCCADLPAQTVQWKVKPEWDEIRQMAPDIYAFKKDGIFSLYRNDEILFKASEEADIITDFVDGYSLLLREINNGGATEYRLVSVISEVDGYLSQTPNQRDYGIDQYPFFSEGLMPVYRVVNGAKLYGYIDTKANLKIDTKFQNIRPFVDGQASVIEKKDKWTTINTDGSRKVKLSFTKKNVDAEDMRFADRKDLKTWLPDLQMGYQRLPNNNIALVKENDLYGYKMLDSAAWVAPPQFVSASQMADGKAIAATQYGTGILQLVEGGITCEQIVGAVSGEYQPVTFIVGLPAAFDEKTVTLNCRIDGADKVEPTFFLRPDNLDPEMHTHQVEGTAKPEGKTVELVSENLVLYRQHFEKEIPVELDAVKLTQSAMKVRAGTDDSAKMTVTVKNISSETITVNISVSGKNASVSRSKMTLKPNASQSVVAYFTNVLSGSTRSVTVTGETDRKVKIKPRSANVQLVPFL